MGAGRLPEQIGDRAEAGRRAMLEDQTPDPLIEKLKATPVERRIVPEEQNRVRIPRAQADEARTTFARRLIIKQRLKAIREAIFLLKVRTTAQPSPVIKGQIDALKKEARRLQRLISGKNRRKVHWKRR